MKPRISDDGLEKCLRLLHSILCNENKTFVGRLGTIKDLGFMKSRQTERSLQNALKSGIEWKKILKSKQIRLGTPNSSPNSPREASWSNPARVDRFFGFSPGGLAANHPGDKEHRQKTGRHRAFSPKEILSNIRRRRAESERYKRYRIKRSQIKAVIKSCFWVAWAVPKDTGSGPQPLHTGWAGKPRERNTHVSSKVRLKRLTSLSDSNKIWSYSERATKNIIEVTFSKQWIHFRLSDLCPPTSTILGWSKREEKKVLRITFKYFYFQTIGYFCLLD